MIQEALTTNPPSHEATARQVNTNEQQFLADGFCLLNSCEFVFIRGLQNQHAIAIAVEAITFVNRFGIRT